MPARGTAGPAGTSPPLPRRLPLPAGAPGPGERGFVEGGEGCPVEAFLDQDPWHPAPVEDREPAVGKELLDIVPFEAAHVALGQRFRLLEGDRHQELAAAYPAQFGHAGREDLRRDVFENLHAGDDIEAVVLEVQRVDAAVGAIDEVGELDILAEPGLIDAGDDV